MKIESILKILFLIRLIKAINIPISTKLIYLLYLIY